MSKRVSKTAIVALGIGIIGKGAEALTGSSPVKGVGLLALGLALVYGYEVLQEKQIQELYETVSEITD